MISVDLVAMKMHIDYCNNAMFKSFRLIVLRRVITIVDKIHKLIVWENSDLVYPINSDIYVIRCTFWSPEYMIESAPDIGYPFPCIFSYLLLL